MLIPRTLWPLLLSAVLMVLSGAVQAELYRWVDENGRVHYTDTPPPPNAKKTEEIDAKRRAAPAAQTDGDAAQGKSYVEQEAEFQKRQVQKAEKQAAEAREKEQAEARKRGCQEARTELAGLQAGNRITQYNAQGERVFLDDREIKEKIAQVKKSIADLCK